MALGGGLGRDRGHRGRADTVPALTPTQLLMAHLANLETFKLFKKKLKKKKKQNCAYRISISQKKKVLFLNSPL